ncbi:hypothetical protein, partial [Amycolatopsis ruanii]
ERAWQAGGMARPSPLQVRNLVVAVLAALVAVWNVTQGGPWYLTAIFGVGCVLALGSAALNRAG